ncbi:MAG: sugar kinase [Candidatus Marinimicrobia bacterium]|nr:sugar kinase [Candidatus Neomarinimicrobiota bacterium]|tara:strand:+ start:520 stop:1419 length:900 start_codon:yes stop_codon:yes gene_type:complete
MKLENDILTIGSIALDTIETKEGVRENILGGSASYFSIAASYFRKVNVLGVVGNDFPKIYWDLYKQFQINTEEIEIKNGPTFRWGGKYSDDYDTRETLFTELGVFENYSPIVNKSVQNSKFIFLGNIHPDMQMSVINKASNEQIIILDTMNLWIDISLDSLKNVIKKTDIFLLNDEEAFLLTDTKNIEDAALILSKMGPDIIIIKKGSLGSYILDINNNIKMNVPAFAIDNVIDTTGAGDSFAGGFVGCLNNYNIVDSVIAGSAIASFTVSAFGVEGLLNITKSEIDSRINHIKMKLKD